MKILTKSQDIIMMLYRLFIKKLNLSLDCNIGTFDLPEKEKMILMYFCTLICRLEVKSNNKKYLKEKHKCIVTNIIQIHNHLSSYGQDKLIAANLTKLILF